MDDAFRGRFTQRGVKRVYSRGAGGRWNLAEFQVEPATSRCRGPPNMELARWVFEKLEYFRKIKKIAGSERQIQRQPG